MIDFTHFPSIESPWNWQHGLLGALFGSWLHWEEICRVAKNMEPMSVNDYYLNFPVNTKDCCLCEIFFAYNNCPECPLGSCKEKNSPYVNITRLSFKFKNMSYVQVNHLEIMRDHIKEKALELFHLDGESKK